MLNSASHDRRRGIIAAEVVVSIALIALMAVLATDAVLDYHHARDRYLRRQAAAWAAAGQLQRYQVGAPIDTRPPDGLVPEGITLETVVEPARDRWHGFNRVTVIATADLRAGTKQVQEQVTGYVPAEVTR